MPGAELDGVVKLDDLDDAREIIRRSAAAKRAVVVGGGITALEIVEGLRAHRVHVDYFMRQDRYWRNVLSETESRAVEEELRAGGVRIHPFTELARIVGRDGRVAAVETADGTRIPCDLVAVAIGVRPRTELARDAGLVCDRGVLVDEYLRTSEADIFAAGDVAETIDPVTGRRTIEVLWHSAVHKGRVAGLNMASGPVPPLRGGPLAQHHAAGRHEHDHHRRGRARQGRRPRGPLPRRQPDLVGAGRRRARRDAGGRRPHQAGDRRAARWSARS